MKHDYDKPEHNQEQPIDQQYHWDLVSRLWKVVQLPFGLISGIVANDEKDRSWNNRGPMAEHAFTHDVDSDS